MIYKLRQPGTAKPLFGDWQETILWSCLQGVMGAVYGDDGEKPRSAAALLGDFCFLAGTPNAELAGFLLPENRTAAKEYSGDAARERREPDSVAGSGAGETIAGAETITSTAGTIDTESAISAGSPDNGDCGRQAMQAAATGRESILLIPQNEAWAQLIERQYGPAARCITRYAFFKESGGFDVQSLRRITAPFSPEETRGAKLRHEKLPCRREMSGYSAELCHGKMPGHGKISCHGELPGDEENGSPFVLHSMDDALYGQLRASGWGRDLVAQYPDVEAWRRLGIGAAALRSADGVAVAGASSYSRYLGGIEIEVDTKEEYRRRGLARACAAQLILDCIQQGLYPSWDAHNPASAHLAEQLGYRMDRPYPAYEVELPLLP